MLLCALPFITSVWSLPCPAQDIEPRRWSHLPIGGNFGGAGYAYTTGEIYLIYTFRPGLWLAGSVGYLGGGVTAVNNVSSDNSQNNLGWGLSLGLPITRAVGVKFAYIGTRTQVGTGLDSDTFATALSVAW